MNFVTSTSSARRNTICFFTTNSLSPLCNSSFLFRVVTNYSCNLWVSISSRRQVKSFTFCRPSNHLNWFKTYMIKCFHRPALIFSMRYFLTRPERTMSSISNSIIENSSSILVKICRKSRIPDFSSFFCRSD